MSRRLVAAGYEVLVNDVDADAVERLVSAGASACTDPLGVADAAEIVMVSLPEPAVVVAVAEQLARGSAMRLYVDLSTTGPQVAEEVAALMAAAEVGVVDAPVSGGATGAEQRQPDDHGRRRALPRADGAAAAGGARLDDLRRR